MVDVRENENGSFTFTLTDEEVQVLLGYAIENILKEYIEKEKKKE